GAQTLRYEPQGIRLPVGETTLTVYLIANNNVWKEIANFPLRVAVSGVAQATPAAEGSSQASTKNSETAAAARRGFGFDKFDSAPTFNIGFKSQFAETHFPAANFPGRPTFTDATLTGSWKSEMARGAMTMSQQFDIVGSSFRNEALRFGKLQDRAP